ncbi:MAG: hypothetical protein AAFQ57_07665 [Cyanobacteria bacterium J06626_14]
MAVTAYSSGDLVAHHHDFAPCGRVITSQDGCCDVQFGDRIVTLPEKNLILISVKNIPNLRLIEQKITAVESALDGQSQVGQSIMAYLGGGSVVSRAFADYILKISPDILAQCLKNLSATKKDIPDALQDVLGLTFRFISGSSNHH